MNEADRQATKSTAWVAAFPAAWLTVELALDAWTISQAWQSAGMSELPRTIVFYLYGLIGGASISMIWGLGVLSLAWSRSPSFPRAFIVWQGAVIAWTVAKQAWAFSIQEFVFTAASFLWPVAEIVIGLIAIAIAAGLARRPAVAAPAAPRPVSGLAMALFAVLGVVVGAVVGAVGGFALGALISSTTDMSCFEGACGYFAAAIGLLGMAIFAVAGGVLAILRIRRRHMSKAG
ncbi:MAG: hypothetical protein AB7I79_23795 [Rhizobiaceae bacterium]